MANLMKKILLVIMSILLLMCVVGCGAEGDDEIEATQEHEFTLQKNGEKIKVTREEIYEKSFADCDWEFTKEYGNQQLGHGIVVVKGKMNVLGKDLNVVVPFHYDKRDGWTENPTVSVNNNISEPSYYFERYIKNKAVDNDVTTHEVLLAWEWRDQFNDKDIKLTDKQIEALVNRFKKNNERMEKGSELGFILGNENEDIRKILKEWGKL